MAAIAIVGVGAAQGVLSHFDVFGSRAMVELIAFIVCVWLLPSEPRRDWTFRLGAALVAVGIAGGMIWVLVIGVPAIPYTKFIPFGEIPIRFYILGLVSSCIIGPLFEEKVVRHLLFDGVSHYFGRVLGAILVSIAFAAVHVGAFVSTFLFSILLCVLACQFRLSTTQLATVHGTINLTITQWVIFYPTLRDYGIQS
ncbi:MULTISPECIES: CPBP family intramembrane glutamic endopeptidase [Stenotrophomonas]|uniref:CPBP family intramembrane glutamic endopeptidase n=1 Tax=Stenotrophomonas TaxID=40323 RepID=UPI0021AC208F|nr:MULTISPECIES: CPBP family intramembrane glutamic endopeptidase [Stenotrophomonas]